MRMKFKSEILSVIAICLSIASIVLVVYQNTKSDEVYYVDLGVLYEGFTMKKEMEQQINTIYNTKKLPLDSLRLELELNQRQVASAKELEKLPGYQIKLQNYSLKEDQFYNEMERLKGNYTEQIWGQLNQYVIDYGKENKARIIMGAAGKGSVMYGDDAVNITTEVLAYANHRYDGKPKQN